MKHREFLRNQPMDSAKKERKKERKEKIVSLNFCHAVFSLLDLQVPEGRLCHLIPVTLFSLLNFLNP